uniref:ABC transporter domain-containing protein n=1 Tax=Glycine max TaxID=3847 RepID=A0A368UHL8_SOYBN
MEDPSDSPPPPPPPPPQTPLKTYKLSATSISYTKSTTKPSFTSLFFTPCTTTPPTYILKDISLTALPSQILAVLLKPKTSNLAAIVSSLLSELRLTHLSNTRLARGLSGGERRRVSIGLCLLHDPAVLLLDEPTSGLDSTSAFKVMRILKQTCVSRNRTIILSIHQPSFKILACIDRILLLSKGQVVHHGSVATLQAFLHSNGFTVPHQLNALEYAMEILSQLNEAKPVTPPSIPESPERSSSVISVSDGGVRSSREIIRYKSSRVHEIFTLYSRFWKIIYRTRQLLLTNTAEALLVGLVLGTIYINIGFDKEGIEKRFGLFAFTLTFLLSSTTETLPIFINERPILLRETSSGVYRLSSYLIANTLVFLPYLFVVAVIYSIPVYFLVGLCASWLSFAYFVLVIWVIVLMANSFVLFLSSLAPNYIAGTSLLTVLLAAFFLFSGYFISKESLPKYWLFMHFFSMYKYALDALLINEYSCLVTKCLIWYQENEQCMVTGGDVLQKKGLKESERWTNVYFLLGFFVLYRVLCFLVLVRRVSRSKT